jgi:regulator of cell morphogenesis and NO signaling
MSIDQNRLVGELVGERIGRARLFDDLGIDYCCHGKVSLAEACSRLGLDAAEVVADLERGDSEPTRADEPDYREMSPGRLADHIESTHHVFMKQELPRLVALRDRVAAAHGSRHPELFELGGVLAAFRDEIDSHLMKEERVLFPLIRQLEAASTLPSVHCGSVNNPIRVMEHEHDAAGLALARMRDLTGGYRIPPEGCESYRALMDGLAAVERDLHRHIHKENNLLFPGAAGLEARLAGSSGDT